MAPRAPWECCSYVLQSKPEGDAGELVAAHARAYRLNMSQSNWFRKANRCFLFGHAQC